MTAVDGQNDRFRGHRRLGLRRSRDGLPLQPGSLYGCRRSRRLQLHARRQFYRPVRQDHGISTPVTGNCLYEWATQMLAANFLG
jgi:hypothetical protein